jgi:hypothetical protein
MKFFILLHIIIKNQPPWALAGFDLRMIHKLQSPYAWSYICTAYLIFLNPPSWPDSISGSISSNLRM